ncbi:hypothetical protein AAFF_G00223170 [Aldrovandia affinis]|uniref:Uncharacterized protein n=1 Tax=Aldrovandia affinis TaxID=143900 RepID=A0AAD7W493_9TELE|nr:hypothetical protein AAFF_G00223170 [Aldrovandia affinis]
MANIGKMDVFDDRQESWASYTERLEQYFIVNDVADDKKVPALLSLIGPKTYGLLRDLTAPAKPASRTFADLVAILQAHLSPKPLIIAERCVSQAGPERRRKCERLCGRAEEALRTLDWLTHMKLNWSEIKLLRTTKTTETETHKRLEQLLKKHEAVFQDQMGTGQDERVDAVEVFHAAQLEALPLTSAVVKRETRRDPILSEVYEYTMTGWPTTCSKEVTPYRQRKEEITTHQ